VVKFECAGSALQKYISIVVVVSAAIDTSLCKTFPENARALFMRDWMIWTEDKKGRRERERERKEKRERIREKLSAREKQSYFVSNTVNVTRELYIPEAIPLLHCVVLYSRDLVRCIRKYHCCKCLNSENYITCIRANVAPARSIQKDGITVSLSISLLLMQDNRKR